MHEVTGIVSLSFRNRRGMTFIADDLMLHCFLCDHCLDTFGNALVYKPHLFILKTLHNVPPHSRRVRVIVKVSVFGRTGPSGGFGDES